MCGKNKNIRLTFICIDLTCTQHCISGSNMLWCLKGHTLGQISSSFIDHFSFSVKCCIVIISFLSTTTAFLECFRIKEIEASLITSELKCIACLIMFYFSFVARRGSSDLTYFSKLFASVLVVMSEFSVMMFSSVNIFWRGVDGVTAMSNWA